MDGKMKKLNLTPNLKNFWITMGYNFENMCQVLHEFVDNAISNFLDNEIDKKKIMIKIKKIGDKVEIIIEDHGSGIIDIENALTLGGMKFLETLFNEHGNGIKHGLSFVDPQNKTWVIMTRTINDALSNKYKVVKAPYSFENTIVETWKGNCLNGSETGTIIKFTTSYEIFKTVRIPFGSQTSQFNKLVDLLVEDLGVHYSFIIKEENIKIVIKAIDVEKDCNRIIDINPIFPNIGKCYINKKQMVDLGNGTIEINLKHIIMKQHFSTKKYYLKNMRSSGVEIRINGRLLEFMGFEEIFGIKSHPFYNGNLIVVNLRSSERGKLPHTRTTKTGLNRSDSKTSFLFKWINSQISLLGNEIEMEKNINDQFVEKVMSLVLINKEDLFLNYCNTKKFVCNCKIVLGDEYDLYFQSSKSKVNDLYFLEKLWDDSVMSNEPIHKIVLIADEHPISVIERVKLINKKSLEGKNYNIVLL